jgi:23S rRNA (adenine2503-C2)-methyltransferase
VAPKGTDAFFDRLIDIRDAFYHGKFQLQFSIHSTDEGVRDRIIPVPKWSLEEISDYGGRFFREGERKITLNFILAAGYAIDPKRLRSIFSPEMFFVKLTPLNPTSKGANRGLVCAAGNDCLQNKAEPEIAGRLRAEGFDVLWSVGDLGENLIGSNCGQYLGISQ